MNRINWKTTREEHDLIMKIVERAVAGGLPQHIQVRDLVMDISAAHLNGNPLALDEMLAGEELDFTHDVYGIMRHIDRTTGKLGDFFSPRFSAEYHTQKA